VPTPEPPATTINPYTGTDNPYTGTLYNGTAIVPALGDPCARLYFCTSCLHDSDTCHWCDDGSGNANGICSANACVAPFASIDKATCPDKAQRYVVDFRPAIARADGIVDVSVPEVFGGSVRVSTVHLSAKGVETNLGDGVKVQHDQPLSIRFNTVVRAERIILRQFNKGDAGSLGLGAQQAGGTVTLLADDSDIALATSAGYSQYTISNRAMLSDWFLAAMVISTVDSLPVITLIDSNSDEGGLSGGIIAVIVLAIVALCLGSAIVGALLYRRRNNAGSTTNNDDEDSNNGTVTQLQEVYGTTPSRPAVSGYTAPDNSGVYIPLTVGEEDRNYLGRSALTDDGGSSQYQDLSIAPSSTDFASTTPVAKKSVLPGEGYGALQVKPDDRQLPIPPNNYNTSSNIGKQSQETDSYKGLSVEVDYTGGAVDLSSRYNSAIHDL